MEEKNLLKLKELAEQGDAQAQYYLDYYFNNHHKQEKVKY